jgi:ketosteroid isomerase-like protein
MTTRAHVIEWLSEYERAWRTAGTRGLDRLFSDDATYQLDPYEPPIEGLDAIAAMWDREREGPDEAFTMRSAIVAIDGDTAVLRLDVDYTGSRLQEYRDLWIVEFDIAGRCRSFEEWPFWSDRPRADPDPGQRTPEAGQL